MLLRFISAAAGVTTSSPHRLNNVLLRGWTTLYLPLHLLRVDGGVSAFQPLCKRQWVLPTSRGVHACNTQHVLWVHVSLTGDSLPWGYSVGSAYLSFRVSEAVTLGPCQAEPKSFASS